ncbi:MAG: UvrD-helicase domain-containing protein [Sedimentisphaerales bacterium]|nr:UvrD-helicase domain-containing protein [Sedimentisphaerales bacterium]
MRNKELSQLTDSQKKAVLHRDGPLLILAGPGSGKTRVITHRIAALIDSGIYPGNICAITFTNKAAEEMKQRAIVLGASAGAHISTFHSLCVRILRRHAEYTHIKPNFTIYSESEQRTCMRHAVKDCNLEASNFPPARMLDAVSMLKNKLIEADAFQEMADDFFSKSLAKLYNRYQQILCENNALDFDDLLLYTAFLLERNDEVRQQLGTRFKYLLIDEYQDTNHAQYRIAKALVSSHNNICVTGDPDQSIYRWRGADISNILAFEKDFPGATTVKLEQNFRSTAAILEIADRLIAENINRKEKTLIPTVTSEGKVEITVSEDESDEAESIAEKIAELADRKVSLKDIAVFYRINASSRPLEEAFIKHKIPYQIVRGVEFYNRKEIRDILAYLKILVNPSDEVALLRIINTPARGIGKTSIERIKAYASSNNLMLYDAMKKAANIESLGNTQKTKIAAFIDMIENLTKDTDGTVEPLAENVFKLSGMEAALKAAADKDAVDNVTALIDASVIYDKSTDQPGLLDYLQQIALFSDTDTYDTAQDRVALMTLHTAKGLEFENVFIIGAEQGLLPHERSSENDDELEEERRLFFVGITRAKLRLNISCARYRTYRGQLMRTIPSEFLFELGVPFSAEGKNEESSDAENEYEPSYDTSDSDIQFCYNQLVRHKKFGLGRITQLIDLGENSTVTVRFNSGKTKTLMLKYANLETIDI